MKKIFVISTTFFLAVLPLSGLATIINNQSGTGIQLLNQVKGGGEHSVASGSSFDTQKEGNNWKEDPGEKKVYMVIKTDAGQQLCTSGSFVNKYGIVQPGIHQTLTVYTKKKCTVSDGKDSGAFTGMTFVK